MIAEFQYKGIWWLPDNSEEKISGTLRFTPGEGAVLDLMGSFKGPFEEIKSTTSDGSITKEGGPLTDKPFEPEIILGTSSDGKEITLHKCFQTNRSYSFPGFPTSSFYANIVFIGAHFQNADAIKFKSISVHYLHLDEWVNISGFNLKLYPNENRGVIEYKLPEPVKACIQDDYTIQIVFKAKGPSWSLVQKETSIKQKTYIKIDASEEIPYEEYTKKIYLIQNFLTLGIMEPLYPLAIEGTTEANKLMIKDVIHYPPVDIFHTSIYIPTKTKPLLPQRMLFIFSDISERFENFLQNWFGKAELLEPVYDLFFGTLYSPSMYLEFQFLSLIQAIESFHRRRYGGKYLVGEKGLFSWDDVLEKDKERLIEFLKDELCIEWVKNAEIHKPSGSKTIHISNGGNSAKIKISTNEREATLKISDGRTLHLNVKPENGKLNIYYEDYAKVRCALEKAIPKVKENLEESLKSRIEYGNEFSLRTRLKEIFDKYQENLSEFVEKKEDFIGRVVDTRNYLTHYDEKLKEKAALGEELDPLIQELKILLEICLLTEVGFSSEEIKELFLRK